MSLKTDSKMKSHSRKHKINHLQEKCQRICLLGKRNTTISCQNTLVLFANDRKFIFPFAI